MSRINNRQAVRQILNFESLTWGAISPTDIDAILELRDQAYVIVEAKREGARWPRGQSILLERLTKDLICAGKHVLTIRATHNSKPPVEVDLGECAVVAYLDRPLRPRLRPWDRPATDDDGLAEGWTFPVGEPFTVRQLIDDYLDDWGIEL